MRIINGSNPPVESPASGPISQPYRFLYDTGNFATQITEQVAGLLGITESTPPDDTQMIDGIVRNGYVIDRVEMDASNGSNTYVINDALVFVKPSLGGSVDVNIGSNFFETTQVLVDLPLNRLGLYTGTRCDQPPVDVYILVDLSGSFIDDLDNFKVEAPAMIDTLTGKNPNTQFGLGRFEDYPIYPFGLAAWGDSAYTQVLDLTPDAENVKATIDDLEIWFGGAGGDWPQSQLAALYQAATGAGQVIPDNTGANIPSGQQVDFRDGATKLFVLWTDAPFHYPGDEGEALDGTTVYYPGPSFDDTVDAIEALDPPMVIGILSGDNKNALDDLVDMANATDAVAPEGGIDMDGDGFPDILQGQPMVGGIEDTGAGIGNAIQSLVEAISPPIANAGSDRRIECTGPSGAEVTFDGSASIDPDGDPLDYNWSSPFLGSETIPGVVVTLTLPCGGTYQFTLTVDDGLGKSNSDTVLVMVQDTTPPSIESVNVSRDFLWPPNHKMVKVTVSVTATDIVDPDPWCRVVDIANDESDLDEPGSGYTSPDWEIVDDLKVKLRAERSGEGDGRVYTLTVRCTDEFGNSSNDTVAVFVPLDID